VSSLTKISLQEYADGVVAPEYRQPLKTVEEACAANGWAFQERPVCCETAVTLRSFMGAAYFGQCSKCGKFIADVAGPSFGNSWVNLIDSTKVDMNTDRFWIAGQQKS